MSCYSHFTYKGVLGASCTIHSYFEWGVGIVTKFRSVCICAFDPYITSKNEFTHRLQRLHSEVASGISFLRFGESFSICNYYQSLLKMHLTFPPLSQIRYEVKNGTGHPVIG